MISCLIILAEYVFEHSSVNLLKRLTEIIIAMCLMTLGFYDNKCSCSCSCMANRRSCQVHRCTPTRFFFFLHTDLYSFPQFQSRIPVIR